MFSPIQSTGRFSLRLQSKSSALRMRFELELLHVCLRHSKNLSVITFLSSPYRSTFTGLKSPPETQTISCSYFISIGVMLTFLRYWLISSDLSVMESKKKYNCENSVSNSPLWKICYVTIEHGAAEGIGDFSSVVRIKHL